MAGSADALSRSVVMGTVLALVFIVLPSLVMGTLGIGFLPDLADTDKFVPSMYVRYFSWGLPLLVLGTFAAGMSTVDTQLLSASSVVVRDIAQPMAGGRLSTRAERRLGQFVVLGFTVLLTILAFLPQAQGSIILLASKGAGGALLLLTPLCGPLLWARASRAGAIASLVVGIVVTVLLEAQLVEVVLPLKFGPPIAALACQVPVFVIGSLWARRPAEAASAAGRPGPTK